MRIIGANKRHMFLIISIFHKRFLQYCYNRHLESCTMFFGAWSDNMETRLKNNNLIIQKNLMSFDLIISTSSFNASLFNAHEKENNV